MKSINIGDVAMPLDDYVISQTAVLGSKNSGKSYLAKGIAEQLLDGGIPIVVFDAIGVWRHLKVAGDGRGARGYKVVVAGGEGGDLPLTPSSAAEIVRAAIRENISLVVDFYSYKLSKADWRRIVQTCFQVLLYENVGARHIFLEESAEFIPQKVFDGETYAAVEKLVRMGGNKSLGITLINQRAQEVNKAVLDLCDNCVLLKQRGSKAIESLEKWMDRVSPEFRKQVALSLPNMGQGDCWVFAGDREDPVRTKSKQLHSFHPDRKKPGGVEGRAKADTADFISRMQSDLGKLLEEQKKNDPAEWKKKLATAEAEIRRLTSQKPGPVGASKEELSAAKTSGYTDGFNDAVAKHDRFVNMIAGMVAELHKCPVLELEVLFKKILDTIADKRVISATIATQNGASERRAVSMEIARTVRAPTRASAFVAHDSIPKGEAAMIAACIQYPDGLRRQQLTTLTGYKKSTRDSYIKRAAEKGLLDASGEPIHVTDAGRAAMPNAQPLPTGAELRRFWLQRLPKGEGEILAVLIGEYPEHVSREEITERTGYKKSTRDSYIKRMRAKEIISGDADIAASDKLFEVKQ